MVSLPMLVLLSCFLTYCELKNYFRLEHHEVPRRSFHEVGASLSLHIFVWLLAFLVLYQFLILSGWALFLASISTHLCVVWKTMVPYFISVGSCCLLWSLHALCCSFLIGKWPEGFWAGFCWCCNLILRVLFRFLSYPMNIPTLFMCTTLLCSLVG